MKKRTEKNPNDTEALGLPRSERHALEVAEGIRRDLDRAQREIDIIRDAQRSVGFDAAQVENAVRVQSEVASLGLDEARVNLDDMRVNLANFRPGLVDNMVPNASEMLKRQAESVRASIYQTALAPARERGQRLDQAPDPPSHISQILDTRSRIQGMLRTLPEVAVKPSSVLPTAAMATRISDMAKEFATSEILKNQQGLYRLVQTANASVAKSFADQIMATNTLSDTSLIMRNSIAAVHSMNSNFVASWRRMMMPNIEAIVRQLSSGILGTLSQYDWETLERHARIQDARRPRTPIGFGARDAYDAFYLNQPWIVDRFLRDWLGIEPNEDRREALWRVLRWTFERTIPDPVKWLVMEDERQAVNYLRTAVYRNERRVRTEKERPNRVWWQERDPETKKMIELPPPTSSRS